MLTLKHVGLINTPKQFQALKSLFKITKSFPEELPSLFTGAWLGTFCSCNALHFFMDTDHAFTLKDIYVPGSLEKMGHQGGSRISSQHNPGRHRNPGAHSLHPQISHHPPLPFRFIAARDVGNRIPEYSKKVNMSYSWACGEVGVFWKWVLKHSVCWMNDQRQFLAQQKGLHVVIFLKSTYWLSNWKVETRIILNNGS